MAAELLTRQPEGKLARYGYWVLRVNSACAPAATSLTPRPEAP
jgi:hypothetical protein